MPDTTTTPSQVLEFPLESPVAVFSPSLSKAFQEVEGFLESVHGMLHPPLAKGDDGEEGHSIKRKMFDVAPHPFDRAGALALQQVNVHHAACIQTLAWATAGLGISEDEGDEMVAELDDVFPDGGFVATMTRVAQDCYSLGEGYLEVIGEKGSEKFIWITASEMYKRQYGTRTFQYLFSSIGGRYTQEFEAGKTSATSVSSGVDSQERFWQDYCHPVDADLLLRAASGDDPASENGNEVDISAGTPGMMATGQLDELGTVIRFCQPSNMNEDYGMPAWLAATGYIELCRIHNQSQHDFFFNRATPQVMIFLYGMKLSTQQVSQLQSFMQPGAGNGWGSSVVMAFPGTSAETSKVQVERLSDALDGTSYKELNDSFAVSTCSAHRLMPSLAGITLPRPMGSANDKTQDIILTEILVTTPMQTVFESVLRCTLGKLYPSLWPTGTKLKRMSEHKDLQAMNTMARQRTGSAGSPGTSDPKQGLKRSDDEAASLLERARADLRKAEDKTMDRFVEALEALVERDGGVA